MSEEKALEILKQHGMTDAEAYEFITGCRKGLQAANEGKVKPWDEVKKELGLE